MNQKSDYAFESTGLTDVGVVRQRNEDTILMLPEQGLWVVADGAGGHSDGHVASQLIVENLKDFKRTDRIGNDIAGIYKSLDKTNNKLLELGESSRIIGSTVSAFLSDGEVAVILWAGDSPLYRLRKGELTQVIEDHNRVEEFIRQGFSEDECLKIPQTQQLTRALGASAPLAVETRILNIQEGDLFLVCSDGLTKELTDIDIAEILNRENTLVEKQDELMSLTLSRGARDNTSIILVNIPQQDTA